MSQAISPTTEDIKKGEPLSVAEFGKRIDHFKDAFKAIFNLQAELYRFGPSHKLEVKKTKIGRKDINTFQKAALHQLGDLKTLYSMKKKKKSPRNNEKLSALFYVSDQLVNFYIDAELGLSDPEDEDSSPLSEEITLITKHHMANSGILTSLFSRYVAENNLKNNDKDKKDRKGRFMPDKRMKQYLSTTTPILFEEDLTQRDVPADLDPKKMKKIQEDLENGDKSAFERIEGRTKKNSNDLVYDKKRGLMFLALMIFSNFYRIQDAYLTEKERKPLKDEDNIAESKRVQSILSNATKWYRNQNKPVRAKA